MKKNFSSNYRPEIEFLRSISILLVILFHFEFYGFDGGFIGVDIFFTISGYLITSIIVDDKNFQIIDFYLKRLKRLLPTIFFVTLITVLLGIFILSPVHFLRLTNSAITVIFGVSNFFFFNESGYFDYEKLFKPLLHTWSLSVELQFYLIWPILILFLNKFFKRKEFLIILLLLIISLSLSTLYSARTSSFFYFTGFRIYEFAIGSLIFFYKKKIPLRLNNIIFFLGLLLIITSAFLFDYNFNFPSFYAFFPCVGAGLVILVGANQNIFSKFIKNKFFKFIGSISFTIYMVHWPLLIFYRYEKMDSLILLEKIILILITILFSVFIYKYVEKPFRNKKMNSNYLNLKLFKYFAFSVILLIFFNYYNKQDNNYISQMFKKHPEIDKVFMGRLIQSKIENNIKNENYKYFVGSRDKKKILVVGDSYAFDFYLALNTIKEYNDNFMFEYNHFDYLYCFKVKSNKDKIINFFNYKILDRRNSCKIAFKSKNFDILKNVDHIIISNRWPKNINYDDLINFFKDLNKNIIIIGNGQKFYDIPTLFFKHEDKINDYVKNLDNDIYKINSAIKKNTTKYKIDFFDKSKLNCDSKCVAYHNKNILYIDKDHWSLNSMQYFGNKIFMNNFINLLN